MTKPHSANFTREISWVAHVARHTKPAAAPGRMIPNIRLRAGKIVAQIDVIVKGAFRVGRRRVGPLLRGIAAIGEFLGVARAAIGTGDLASVQIRLRANSLFIDDMAGAEAVER